MINTTDSTDRKLNAKTSCVIKKKINPKTQKHKDESFQCHRHLRYLQDDDKLQFLINIEFHYWFDEQLLVYFQWKSQNSKESPLFFSKFLAVLRSFNVCLWPLFGYKNFSCLPKIKIRTLPKISYLIIFMITQTWNHLSYFLRLLLNEIIIYFVWITCCLFEVYLKNH